MSNTTPAPADAEIEALAAQHLDAVHQFGRLWIEGEVEFARAVLAKWGAQPAASPAQVVARYRLLERGRDKIQAGDEFLREDGVTWRTDPSGIFVGCTYEGNILLPARRAIDAAHGIKEQ